MFETFLNFSQLKMSFSWRVNPKKDKKNCFENFWIFFPGWLTETDKAKVQIFADGKSGDNLQILVIYLNIFVTNIQWAWLPGDKLPGFWCTPSGKMFYLNDLI